MKKDTNRQIKIGDIYTVKFDGSGSEQQGFRPALVFQNNTGNKFSPNVVILPLSSSVKKTNQPTHVFVSAKDTGLIKDSMVICENPVCIAKEKLGKYLTTLPQKYIQKVAVASLLSSSVVSFINPELLLSVWQRAIRLNSVQSNSKLEVSHV